MMKTGKPSESVLKRSIIKPFKNRRKEVIQGAGVGEDCALFSLEENMTATSVSAFSVLNSGFFSAQLMAAVNNVAASGAEPVAILISAVLPKDYEEKELKALSTEAEMVCQSLNIQAAGGDTRYSSWVLKPQISVTVLGKKSFRSTFTKKSSPGQDVVMTKWLGLAGTAFLAKQKREDLKKRLPAGLLDEAEKFMGAVSVLEEAALAVKSGADSMHDISRGGLFTALWELAEKDGIGLEIDI
ncbi:MAG: AIR synthase related protein, partial [Lachnospiraceae bacterium]